MSAFMYVDDLRDIAGRHGYEACDLAADEIESLEKAYALLFAENARLQKLVEAQPAAVAGEAVLIPRKLGWAIYGLLAQECAPCLEPECRISSNPEALITQCREQLYPLIRSSAPAAPLVGEPTAECMECGAALPDYPALCPRCPSTGAAADQNNAEHSRLYALAQAVIDASTNDYTKCGDYYRVPPKAWLDLHEEVLHLQRHLLAELPESASPAAPAGVPTPCQHNWMMDAPGDWICTKCGVHGRESGDGVFPVPTQPNSFHRSAADASEASGSAIPARPTLPGEDAPRTQLWSDAYMARLKQGNSVGRVDYMAHHAAIEVADKAIEAFDKRFCENSEATQ